MTEKQRKILIIIAIIVVIGVIYFNFRKDNNKTDLNTNILVQNTNPSTEVSEEDTVLNSTIFVHIAGGVKNPGVVKLEEGSRIEDAISEAGGLTEDADITNVNLAYVVDDGIKINIPRTSIVEISEEKEQEIIQEGSGENVVENNLGLTNSIRPN